MKTSGGKVYEYGGACTSLTAGYQRFPKTVFLSPYPCLSHSVDSFICRWRLQIVPWACNVNQPILAKPQDARENSSLLNEVFEISRSLNNSAFSSRFVSTTKSRRQRLCFGWRGITDFILTPVLNIILGIYTEWQWKERLPAKCKQSCFKLNVELRK